MDQAYEVAKLLLNEIGASFVPKEAKNSWMLEFYDLDSRVRELQEFLADCAGEEPQ